MKYFGKYLVQIKQKRVTLPYHLEGKCFQVVCIKTNTKEMYLAVLPSDSGSLSDLPASYEILQTDICCIHKSLKLPEVFLDSLGDNKVVVVGVGDHIELFSEPYFIKSENTPTITNELPDALEQIGLS